MSLHFASNQRCRLESQSTTKTSSRVEAVTGLTNLQLELLKIFSIPPKEDQLKETKALLSRYFAEKATGKYELATGFSLIFVVT